MFRLDVRDGSNVAMSRSIAFLLQHQPVDSPKALALGNFSPSIPRRARKLSKNFRSGTGSWNPANYIVLRYPPGASWRAIEPFLRENQPNQQKPAAQLRPGATVASETLLQISQVFQCSIQQNSMLGILQGTEYAQGYAAEPTRIQPRAL